MRIKAGYLFLLASLGAVLTFPTISFVQSTENAETLDLSVATKAADGAHSALDRFDRLVTTAGELCRKHCDTIETVDGVLDEVENGFKVLEGDPLLLDQGIVDRINEDAERMEGLSGTPTPLKILTPEMEVAMNGDDEVARRQAYRDFIAARNAYQDRYERWLEKREQAQRIYEDAESAYQRVIQLDQKLEDLVSNSPVAFLVYFYRFDHLLADVKIPLTEAIVRRASAAHDLKESYDKAIIEMRIDLRRTEGLHQWINFTEFQDAFQDTPPPADNVESFLNSPTGGTEALEEARTLFANIKKTNLPTEQEQFIARALDKMRISNQEVREAVAKLLREANDADAEARRAQRIQTFLQQGVAVAGSVWQAGANSPTASSTGPALQYNYTTTGWGTNPDGTLYFYRHQFDGSVTAPVGPGGATTMPNPN